MILLGLPYLNFSMFLTYISKNFDDGPVPFGNLLLVIFAVSILFPKSLTSFGRFSASFVPSFFKRDAKVMEIISSPNFIEI